jgi:MFS family permease
MNVAISSIANDLGTTVHGVQIAITLFTLTMAALMIPGSKLTDIWGRKFCFVLGLIVYGLGALLAAIAQGVGILIVGYSLLEGIGSALLIPPVYILVTVTFPDMQSRAKSFGIISAAAGIGAILSAAGLFFVVLGILQSGTYGWFTASQDFAIGTTVVIPQGGISPVWLFVGIGTLFLLWFFLHIRSRERAGKEPLLSPRLFRNRVSNLGLVTQNIQWPIMQGSFFVISVFLTRHLNVDVNTIQQRTTDPFLVAHNRGGRAATFPDRVAEEAAGAGERVAVVEAFNHWHLLLSRLLLTEAETHVSI